MSEVKMMKNFIQLAGYRTFEETQQKSNQTAHRKMRKNYKITRNNIVLSEKEVLLKTKAIYYHLLKKQQEENNIKINNLFQNAIILPDGSDSEWIRCINQRIRHLKKSATMIEKETIKGIARLQKEEQGIPKIHLPRIELKKK